MGAFGIDESLWAFRLAPAFAVLDRWNSGSHEHVKKAILQRYHITVETNHQKFRHLRKQGNESFREFAVWMEDIAGKWTKECTSKEDLLEL